MGRERKYPNGYQRECPSQGAMREKGEIVNQLPPVGSRVIVEHYKLKSKNALALDRDEEGYGLHAGYVDCFGRPRIYAVDSYTHGIDNPFDVRNSVILITNIRGEHILKQTIKTVDIASGYIRLVPAPKEGDIRFNGR